ncbi:MAG: hypothetical protein IPN01_05870 [Deltaproteobacteria bacterium]|nr:hypothetical protein [Deltaproteobacteria bacterium]
MTAPRALLLTLLLAPTLAFAARVGLTTASCPLDGAQVSVYERLSTNTHGGWDSDLAAYDSESQWRSFALSACPKDGLILPGSNFGRPVSAAQRAALEAALKAQRAAKAPSTTAWERYARAAELRRAMGDDGLEVAQLYLEGSWTARDEAVGVYLGLEGPIEAEQILAYGDAELLKPEGQKLARTLLYNLARVAHRGGFLKARDGYLSRYEALPELTSAEREKSKRLKTLATGPEAAMQRLALVELARFLKASGAPAERVARARYLQADLHRRLGDEDAAIQGYAQVALDEEAPEQLRELAAFLGTRTGL